MADKRIELKARVDRNRANRQAELEKSRPYKERMREVKEAKDCSRVSFWCDPCSQDFDGIGYKEVRSKPGQLPYAWFVGICPQGHKAIRRITEKHLDPYYEKSAVIRRQRIDLADAFLTPADPRFKQVYPAAWRRMQEQREAAELNGAKAT